MTKPMVFNYADHERALEEIAKLKEDIANLQIRCRIAESEKHGDLISRDDAIDVVGRFRNIDGISVWHNGIKESIRIAIIEDLAKLPSADAVEVVRCKDCKHRHEAECPMYLEEQIDIDEGDGYYDTDYIFHDYTQDDGYCSCGERREDGE